MAFQYQYPGQLQGIQGLQYPGLEYPEQQQEQPQQQGMDPSTMLNAYQQFAGGSGGAAGAGSTGSGISTASQASGVGAGQLGGVGSGGGSAVASAGPWAALAAIIAVNEYNAVGGGYRSEDEGQYTQDLFSGEVLGQDLEKRWLPKLGLKEGSKENKWASHLIHPVSADLGESWESFKDLF